MNTAAKQLPHSPSGVPAVGIESSALFGVVDVSKLTEHDWLQVDMAARGCVSGRLYEWPHLGAAFERAGITRNPAMASDVMRDLCRLLLMLLPNGKVTHE